jgi:hypothetical protein
MLILRFLQDLVDLRSRQPRQPLFLDLERYLVQAPGIPLNESWMLPSWKK